MTPLAAFAVATLASGVRALSQGRGMRGALGRTVIVAMVVLAVAGCTSAGPSASSTSSPGRSAGATDGASPPESAPRSASLPTDGLPSTTATVVRWVDGDTLVSSAGRVRLLGMDTPERGQCGFEPATSYTNQLAPPGSTIRLVSVPGDDDRDRYDRLLRYVYVDTIDVGYAQILAGYARARYDSRDGYGPHPHESAYVAADAANASPTCPG